MKHNQRLAKLRQRQQQLAASIRATEAEATIQWRRKELRAKINLGGALLGLPEGERDALLATLLPHMSERDRKFVVELLTGGRSSAVLPSSDASLAD